MPRAYAWTSNIRSSHQFVVRAWTLLWSSSVISDISLWRDTKLKTSE